MLINLLVPLCYTCILVIMTHWNRFTNCNATQYWHFLVFGLSASLTWIHLYGFPLQWNSTLQITYLVRFH